MDTLKRLLRPLASRRLILFSHYLRGVYAAVRFGFPARGMLVMGVTGTKGKTITSHFLASIMEEAGYAVGMATTADFKIKGNIWLNDTNKTVMPPLKLQKLLRQMRTAGCTVAIVEVTSIGLDQHRLWGIPFQYAGLTNITSDHLDYHGTWEAYQKAKLTLFQLLSLKAVAVNAADLNSGELFLRKTTAPCKWSYSLDFNRSTPGMTDFLYATNLKTASEKGTVFTLNAFDTKKEVNLKLPGDFMVENALCASALCLSVPGVTLEQVAKGLEKVTAVPGRLEKVPTKNGVEIMVDYAHTPDSLERLYSTMRQTTPGKLIAVLGSTGDRDKGKRPEMGALAAQLCDYVYVTDEEPYTEDPLIIIEAVAAGVATGRSQKNGTGENVWWWKVPDRTEAISQAIALAKPGDLVLVTGMGSQNFKIVGDKQVSWNDRSVIETILRQKNLL